MPQKTKTTNIFVAGVGGQGILKFSSLLCEVAMSAGLDVKKSEVHGMAQRGGSVTTHVRFGEKVYSPLIPQGSADFLVSMEHLESVRHIAFLNREQGKLIYDSYEIAPPEVYTAQRSYPADVEERIEKFAPNRLAVPAFENALAIKNPRAQNVIMLGALSTFLDFDDSLYEEAIRLGFKEKYVDSNLKAFALGKELAKE
jgi:indolepyruvate ferredoxin oxidoreductase beta subunit